MSNTDDNGTPLYQEEDVNAAHMARELSEHFDALKALNWEPKSNQREIAWHRAEARSILDSLTAHLLLTERVHPIKAAQSVTYDAAQRSAE